jgi:hypothetical protein
MVGNDETFTTSDDPAPARSRASQARRRMRLAVQCFLAGRAAQKYFRARGRRKSLKRLKTDKENQEKPSLILELALLRLGPILLNLAKFGFGLDQTWLDLHHAEYVNCPCRANPPQLGL